ncbi:P-loop containing nucleoside triphosphate hydrolase protein [Patellaria atrata CBS 101060]|uniref:P-loop containing nucleoside triphosphate hydrolase protein n=1 Tax=Patellaria atrata CBS 101060 TaxID=1346257 RepID=A0A9P4SIG4_9PEZI|nr:P-loop containing nucleoside triphosphate hydrolase protein [Patellaria atrata CBS 101060]
MDAPNVPKDSHLSANILGNQGHNELAILHRTFSSSTVRTQAESRNQGWQRNIDIASLSTTQPRTWRNEVAAVPKSFIRQILGLNPFKTSYFTLYRPVKSVKLRLILFCGILFSVAAGIPLPLIGVIFGKIIDNFPPEEHELQTRIAQLLGVACAYFVVTWGWAVCWGTIGEMVSRNLREALVEKVLGMEQAFFDVEAPDITTVLTEKTQTIQLGTSEKVGLFLQSISYFVAAFTVGFILNAKLTGILLAAVIPAMIVVVCLGTHQVSSFSKKASHSSEKASGIAESSIRAVQVVQAFGASDTLATDHLESLESSTSIGIRKSIAGGLMLGCIFFVAYAANALAFWEGHQQQRENDDHKIGAGTIYAVVFLILDASFVVGQFGPFIQTFALAAAAGEKIFALLDHADAHINVYSNEGEKPDREHFRENIIFKDVTFVYPARPTVRVLDGANFTFKSGQTIGIVGPSGSGKSTLAALLLRLYDPSSGRIMIGSHDIRSYHIAALRSHIAVVDQNPVLFSGTILDNIKYGLSDAGRFTEEEIRKLCEKAAADAHCDFIADLPNGMSTLVGPSGATQLSGGQKQRIALARALVRDPWLLILDEYTSAMDATTECLVLETLRRDSATSRRTTIIIAHRLATIKDADTILLMVDGHLMEQGTHDSLMNLGGKYKDLVEAQRFGGSSPSASPAQDQTTPAEHESSQDNPDPTVKLGKPTASQTQLPPLGVFTLIRRCIVLSKPESPFMIVGMIASMTSGSIIVGEAIVFGNLVDILNKPGNIQDEAEFFCLMFFILSLVALFSYSASGISFGVVSEKLIQRVRDKSLRTILRQDLEWFSDASHSAHRLMSTMTMDAGHLSGLSGVILGTLLSVMTSVFGGIILAHFVAWKIAIVLLAAVPVMLFSGFMRLRVLSKAEERHQVAYSHAAALASEACAAIKTVAALGRERDILRLYKRAIKEPYQKSLKYTAVSNILLAFSLAITYFVYALAYWWGSKQVRSGKYTVRDFFIVLPALLFSAQAAGQMFSLAPEVTRAKQAAQSVFTLHDQRPSIMSEAALDPTSYLKRQGSSSDASPDSRKMSTSRRGDIDFLNVWLTYDFRPDIAALKNINLGIRAGQFIAFVGRSGAGKSSMIALIERFLDPSSGTILFDGEDIRTVPVPLHRGRIGLVAQESDLFPGTVTFNVSLGRSPGQIVTEADVIRACKQCGIHDFIMGLPEGYQTECGKNGSRLSGGQRQRIAIARALIRDPEILLLDEATSQLDAQSEQAVQKAIAAASSGRTTIMVAHRLASVQNADCIYVFDHGSIVEYGRHEDLVARGGIYMGMVAAQELS